MGPTMLRRLASPSWAATVVACSADMSVSSGTCTNGRGASRIGIAVDSPPSLVCPTSRGGAHGCAGNPPTDGPYVTRVPVRHHGNITPSSPLRLHLADDVSRSGPSTSGGSGRRACRAASSDRPGARPARRGSPRRAHRRCRPVPPPRRCPRGRRPPDARRGPHGAVEPEFPDQHQPADRLRRHGPVGGRNAAASAREYDGQDTLTAGASHRHPAVAAGRSRPCAVGLRTYGTHAPRRGTVSPRIRPAGSTIDLLSCAQGGSRDRG
jgi:hypothetical protein